MTYSVFVCNKKGAGAIVKLVPQRLEAVGNMSLLCKAIEKTPYHYEVFQTKDSKLKKDKFRKLVGE